ncbi:hypothetical protein SANTM175S_00946 [Streptomyces antimycoticus]
MAQRFYTRLFGWRPDTDPRREAGGYTVARLGGAAVAGLAPLYQPSQPVAWNVSFAVADADAAVRAVASAGGTVLLGPVDVFDAGRFAVAADPSGAVFQLWQADAFPGAGLFDAPGSLGWWNLLTRAPREAAAFYTTVLGWSVDPSLRYPRWGVDGADFGGMVVMDDKFPHEVPAYWSPVLRGRGRGRRRPDDDADGGQRADGAHLAARRPAHRGAPGPAGGDVRRVPGG